MKPSYLAEIGFGMREATPVVLAAEVAECGLACLVMIAQHHGLAVDLNGLRQRYPSSALGDRLRTLMKVADQLGFSSRAMRIELDSLSRLALPAILHWDLNHYVVLTKVSKRSIVIHDPSVGARTISLSEVSDRFTGVVLELSRSDKFAQIVMRAPLKLSSIWTTTKGITGTLFLIFGLSAALQILAFAAPFQLQLIIDEAIAQADQDLLTVIALAFVGLALLQTAIQFLRDKTLLILNSQFGYQFTSNIIRHVLRLPAAYFEKRHLGDIVSRIRSSEPIRDTITQGIVGAVIDGMMASFAVIVLFVYSPLLTAVVLASIAIYLVVILFSYSTVRGRTAAQIVANAKEQTNLMETLRAAVTIKIMGGEVNREAAWRKLYATVTNTNISVRSFQINLATVQGALMPLQGTLILYLGAGMVIDNKGFSVGMLIAYMSFRQTFSDRLMSLISQVMQFRLLNVHMDRLADIVQTRSDTLALPNLPIELEGELAIHSVRFGYSENDEPVLVDCSAHFRKGAFVAITGRTGCGKSTLVRLLLGLYAPQSGEILLDGQKATPPLWNAWRESIGYVAQDDRLLSGSIADNIAFFDSMYVMDRVKEAAKAAQVHDEIERMPLRYLSTIGDMGSALSGGQRQRLLLARALYRLPKLLILDEGTANLDEKTEESIANVLADLPITKIVVAHRPALLRKADEVYVLENGQLRLLEKLTNQSASPASEVINSAQ